MYLNENKLYLKECLVFHFLLLSIPNPLEYPYSETPHQQAQLVLGAAKDKQLSRLNNRFRDALKKQDKAINN